MTQSPQSWSCRLCLEGGIGPSGGISLEAEIVPSVGIGLGIATSTGIEPSLGLPFVVGCITSLGTKVCSFLFHHGGGADLAKIYRITYQYTQKFFSDSIISSMTVILCNRYQLSI